MCFRYKIYNLHWHIGSADHKGSEHKYDGITFPMELHVVLYHDKHIGPLAAKISKTDWALAQLSFIYQVSILKSQHLTMDVDC